MLSEVAATPSTAAALHLYRSTRHLPSLSARYKPPLCSTHHKHRRPEHDRVSALAGKELTMATNPQYPQHKGPQEVKRYKDDHAKLQVPPKRAFPWILLVIAVAAAILAALIYWLPQTPARHRPPSAAQVPQQPTGNQVQFFNLKMQP